MKKYAIIAAGGSGSRMQSSVPKQFLEINGRSVLWHSVKAFTDAFTDISVIVVSPASHIEQARKLCCDFTDIQFIPGGVTRFQSVKNGLALVKDPSIVFVHDAVRCLASIALLRRCYEQAVKLGSAIPAIAVNDSIRIIEGDSNKVIDRDNIRIIQTPQTFRSEIIIPAFGIADDKGFTDEATVVEANSAEIVLIEGEQTNIKITRPVDLLIAEKIFEQRSAFQ